MKALTPHIRKVDIRNFKSISHLEIEGFKRINLFIGKPNVGKSNILEALSLYAVSFFNGDSRLTSLLRAEKLGEIFHDGNISEPAVIQCFEEERVYLCSLRHTDQRIDGILKYTSGLLINGGRVSEFDGVFDENFVWKDNGGANDLEYRNRRIKRYIFKRDFRAQDVATSYLLPPFGANILDVLLSNQQLRKAVAGFFAGYGLNLVLDRATSSVRIQKEIGANEIFSLPYSSIADTLQRIIFYKTAIVSNTDSVLIFEEPEAHAYPPYIAEFTQEVINSERNQFFMATHSPIVVNDFLENAIEDLAIFMVDFKDGQTQVKSLTREEIGDVYKYGIDLFFNGESYPV